MGKVMLSKMKTSLGRCCLRDNHRQLVTNKSKA